MRDLHLRISVTVPDDITDWDVIDRLVEAVENLGWEWHAVLRLQEHDDEQQADQKAD